MKITTNWLKDHLDTKFNENQIIDKLTDIGLEVESVQPLSDELDSFLIAKILKTEKHPDADRLKVCDVDIGAKKSIRVVCGAPNVKVGLITIYAPPGAVIPKNQMKLVVTKIRGITSQGMLCSEAELNLSSKSDGITELSNAKYSNKIGKKRLPIAEAIYNGLGSTLTIEETHMQAATVLCASGIAFWMRLIRATTQGGVQLGFDADVALKMSMQTAMGAASLLIETGSHPEEEIDRVTTPRGCTITGLNEMEHQGLSSSLIKGLNASFNKINDIAKQ